MKRKVLAILVSLVLVIGFALPVLADDGIDVTLSDILVTTDPLDDGTYVGHQITTSGIITVNSEADAWGLFPYAEANAEGGYSIKNPSGSILFSGSQSDSDSKFKWIGYVDAEANVTINWTKSFYLTTPGNYFIRQYGYGDSYSESWFWFWKYCESDSESKENSKTIVATWDMRGRFQISTKWGDYCDVFLDNNTTTREVIAYGKYNEIWYKLVIPYGTKITCASGKTPQILVLKDVVHGQPVFDPDMTLSKPCVLYQNVSPCVVTFIGRTWATEWNQILSFTSIVGGIAK